MSARADGRGRVICVDGGTTRTRAIVLRAGRVVGVVRVDAGARDTARSGGRRALARGVRRALAGASRIAARSGDGGPLAIVAAGMIGSTEGLAEVPHVPAPAGAAELAGGARLRRVAGARVPVLFVPGVRSGPSRVTPLSVGAADVVRGEETIALGLAAGPRAPLRAGGLLVSLGSHWKAIRLDRRGRVAGSVSALSGELLAAVAEGTVLAAALPPRPPSRLARRFFAAGARLGARAGLPRALYAARLLAQRGPGDAAARYAFVLGALVEASWPVLGRVVARARGPVVLVGAPAFVAAIAPRVRRAARWPVRVLSPLAAEAAFAAGCLAVLRARHAGRAWP